MKPLNKAIHTCLQFVIALGCLLSAGFVTASSSIQAAHGTIALVQLPTSSRAITSVVFQGKSQLIHQGYGIVAVPLDTKPGLYQVTVNTDTDQSVIDLKVLDKAYPEEHITIEDEEKVTPPPATLERIAEETTLMRNAYALFSDQPVSLLPLHQPVQGRVSGVFGSKRFFNGKPRNPHSGIDWAAPIGTPIESPAPGKVAVVGNFFFNGKTVLIDHGGGFVSMMCHLNEIHVKEGQVVSRAEQIGEVGTTGRSTGPHLHWSVSLGGIRTDPAVFLAVLNSLSE